MSIVAPTLAGAAGQITVSPLPSLTAPPARTTASNRKLGSVRQRGVPYLAFSTVPRVEEPARAEDARGRDRRGQPWYAVHLRAGPLVLDQHDRPALGERPDAIDLVHACPHAGRVAFQDALALVAAADRSRSRRPGVSGAERARARQRLSRARRPRRGRARREAVEGLHRARRVHEGQPRHRRARRSRGPQAALGSARRDGRGRGVRQGGGLYSRDRRPRRRGRRLDGVALSPPADPRPEPRAHRRRLRAASRRHADGRDDVRAVRRHQRSVAGRVPGRQAGRRAARARQRVSKSGARRRTRRLSDHDPVPRVRHGHGRRGQADRRQRQAGRGALPPIRNIRRRRLASSASSA